MDLRKFVQETLDAVMAGVADAQASQKGKGGEYTSGFIAPSTQWLGEKQSRLVAAPNYSSLHNIEFDVAVTVEETAGVKGGIKVLGLSVGGDMGAKNNAVSRVKFSVPVAYPKPE